MALLAENLAKLTPDQLHQTAIGVARRYSSANWDLMRCLREVERSGLYREHRCGSAVAYGVRFLGGEPGKLRELLRVARVLEKFPLLDAAVRNPELDEKLGWRKVQEITRILSPENQERLLEFALNHTLREVERTVVCSPRAYRKAAAARRTGSRAGYEPAPRGAAPQVQGVATDGPTTPPPPTAADSATATRAVAAAPANATMQRESVHTGVQAGLFEESPEPTPAPPAETPEVAEWTLIDFHARMTPGILASVEQAMNLLSARAQRRLPRGEALAEMARLTLASATPRTQVRYMVHVHVDGLTGAAWVQTDRGLVPADPDVVKEAMEHGRSRTVHRETVGLVPRPGLLTSEGQTAPVAAPSVGLGSAPETSGANIAPEGDPHVTPPPPGHVAPDGGHHVAPPGAPHVAPEGPAHVPPEGGPVVAPQGALLVAAEFAADDGGPALETPRRTVDTSAPAAMEPSVAQDRDGVAPTAPRGAAGHGRAHRSSRRRQAVPMAVLRQLFEEAGGCCQDCGAMVTLDGSHAEPYCEVPVHDPERMRLRCRECHNLADLDDFERREEWRAAREASIRRRRARKKQARTRKDTPDS